MKIDRVAGVTGPYQVSRPRHVEKGRAHAAKGDGVSLSKEAQEVAALKEKLAQAADVRQERVAELRQQIKSGLYRPDGREVADRMLRSKVFDELA